ncbi:RimJ/RimL family protein N-acetyltransferase [Granulicella aggregans]|uniref:RimJ/RimL family protein N-acetyltransferase n=1 Tax=Granulicella aggregans TaxID=474949 RepID=A0A7W7ZFT1_9BACT|nr:RimJ/RimL family protein N-acetyltransferase [Granulicella aggregans]
MEVSGWNGVPNPEHKTLDGAYVRLEPLQAEAHASSLFRASQAPGAEDRFRYLFDEPPTDLGAFSEWVSKLEPSRDPMFFAVIDKRTGLTEGRQTLMRINRAHGVIEIGNILWGPAIARTRAATEALFLFADYIFALGYRRFEWKCNDLNVPSKRAAKRFGFQYEGLFRRHMVVKGQSRDTAWFSMLDSEWPRLRVGYLRWLNPENFDSSGQQLSKLRFEP